MSALDEIRAREQRASDEIARLTTGNPGTNWRWSTPANPDRDSDLILADSLADVPRLLVSLRAVLNLHECITEGTDEPYCRHCHQSPYGHAPYPCPTVEAITEVLEGGAA